MEQSLETGIGGMSLDINEVSSKAFDIFSQHDFDTSFKRGQYIDYYPIGTVDSRGPFEFIIPRDIINWTDMQKTRLEGSIKVIKSDNTDLPISADISICNLFFQSLFENILFEIENVKLDDPTPRTYPYKAYLETLLSYSTNVKKNWLNDMSIWEEDSPNHFDNLSAANNGFLKRKNIIKQSNNRFFSIPLHLDCCHCYKFLPPNLSMKFSFRRNNDEFSLLHNLDEEFKIEIKNLKLKIFKITPSEKIINYYNQNIKRTPAKLNIDRSIIKHFTIPAGTSNLSQYKVFEGNKLPEQIFIFFVDHSAFNGVKNKNPFNFLPYDLCEANLVVNGMTEPPNRYKMDINSKNTYSFFNSFLENTGISNDNREIGISHKQYFGGSFIISFDRSPDKSNRYRPFMAEGGVIDVNLYLKTPLENVITMLIYATYTDIISIDNFSNITTTFSI